MPCYGGGFATGERAAASGIGQATVSLLEAAGHEVFTTARNPSKITPDAVWDATDFAGNNLRVNAVAPGLTEAPLTQSLTANESTRQRGTCWPWTVGCRGCAPG